MSIGEISTPILSEMSDQELMAFLAANDVSVPPELAVNPHFFTILHNIVSGVENDPHKHFLYNYTVMLTFAQEVQAAVNRYYNVTSSVSPMATYPGQRRYHPPAICR